MKYNKVALALGFTGMVGLVGCGDSSSSPPNSNPSQFTHEIKAIDGYLQNAKVWLDLNGNFKHDSDEPSAMSGAGGKAVLDVAQMVEQGMAPNSYQVVVQAIAGETIDEDKPDERVSSGFTMSAPAGAVNVTPLSTLVNIKLSESVTEDMSADKVAEVKQQAVSELASELGIDESAILSDYIADKSHDDQNKSDAAQQAAYAARSIVESGQVLPETPQEMSEVVEQVKQSDTETDFEKLASVVNNEIKKEVEETPDPQMLEDAQPAIDKDADMVSDSDQDGVPDELDPFPEDSSEWMDNDDDGIGDHTDVDDDNDGINDEHDHYPLDAKRAGDPDGDGIDSVNDQFPYDFDNDSHPDAEDAFPKDPTEWLDSDGDKVGDNSDRFPDDPKEWADSDGDKHGDNSDAFPNDPAEWADTDDDSYGDNSDAFPDNPNEWSDSDQDGFGDNSDIFPDDAEKSVADVVTTQEATQPVIFLVCEKPLELKISITQTVETLNNGSLRTKLDKQYWSLNDQLVGQEESVELQTGNQFTRIIEFSYDFNLDGESSFVGTVFDLGERTPTLEKHYSYIDESAAATEGCDNGGGRIFDNVNFTSRTHPTDLTGVDTVQYVTKSIKEQSDLTVVDSQTTQYDVVGFDYQDLQGNTSNYARHDKLTNEGLLSISALIEHDWEADGTINRTQAFTIEDTGYSYSIFGPVWANPTDGQLHEYADYNFTTGNWDNLTPYWYELTTQVNQDGRTQSSGKRYLLNQENEANTKLDEALLFHEWDNLITVVSDGERTEYVAWNHYHLAGYEFTSSADDLGQAYRVSQKHDNGLWISYSFDEWGSRSVQDLPTLVENARSGGAELTKINSDIIPGLHRYAAALPNQSFQYSDEGEALNWYVVSQNPGITDGTPTLLELQLIDHGIKPNWYVGTASTDIIVMLPKDPDNIWNWYNSFYRMYLQTYAMDTSPNNFSWANDLGYFFLDDGLAYSKLDELLNPEYRVCTSENRESSGDALEDYPSFHHSANVCGYIGIDESYLNDVTLYFTEQQEQGENELAITFKQGGRVISKPAYKVTIESLIGISILTVSLSWHLMMVIQLT
ncbi:hypothetical protein [Vibrio variabilis]|uniref:hypothetical protein n=1 Tax=Vibrio variabilis TaxID=990271 RepID=UPI000DD578C3|nr:hypothetical protein [Vibrio variabilis]